MGDFLNALSTMEKVYFFVGLAGTVFFLLQTVFTFFDLGDSFDLDSDFDGDLDTDLSFFGLSMPLHLFTIRGIVGFVMVFGWAGFGFSQAGLHPALVLFLSLFAGFLMMLIIAVIYYGVSKLTTEGNVNIMDAIGKEGQVYLTIPGEKQGMGKVHLILNGSLREYDAITLKESIKTGEIVKVVDVINETLVVEIRD